MISPSSVFPSLIASGAITSEPVRWLSESRHLPPGLMTGFRAQDPRGGRRELSPTVSSDLHTDTHYGTHTCAHSHACKLNICNKHSEEPSEMPQPLKHLPLQPEDMSPTLELSKGENGLHNGSLQSCLCLAWVPTHYSQNHA